MRPGLTGFLGPERRAKRRYAICLPAQFSILLEGGKIHLKEKQCVVFDMSSDAVSLLLPENHHDDFSSPNLRGEVKIDWPAKLHGSVPMALWVWGRVEALHSVPNRLVVAVEKHEFVTRGKRVNRAACATTA